MPFMTEKRYDAILFFLKSTQSGSNSRSIDWNSEPLLQYAKENFGEGYSFCNVSEEKNKSRRKHFMTTCFQYSLSPSSQYPLQRKSKPVARPSQYEAILQELHDMRGHPGSTTLSAIIRKEFEQFDTETIRSYVAKCMICIEMKPANRKTLHITPIQVYTTFQRLGIDFAVFQHPLKPEVKVNLLVMIDYFSRFCWVKVLGNEFVKDSHQSAATGEAVAEILLTLFLTLCRIPQELQSDNGTQFVSACVRSLMTKLKVQMKFAAPNHPTTGGRFERMVGTLKQILTGILQNNNYTIELAAALACYEYNGRPHTALSYKGQQMCPIDVWQPDQRLRLCKRVTILPDELSGMIPERCTSKEPSFSEEAFDALATATRKQVTTATQAVMFAEGRISHPSSKIGAQKKVQQIGVGDIGVVKVPKDGMHKTSKKNLNVVVHNKGKKGELYLRPIDAKTKEPTPYIISKPVPQSQFYLRESANEGTSTQSPINPTAERPSKLSTDLQGYIFAEIKLDMSLLYYCRDTVRVDEPRWTAVQQHAAAIHQHIQTLSGEVQTLVMASIAYLLSIANTKHLPDSIPSALLQYLQAMDTAAIESTYPLVTKELVSLMLLAALWDFLDKSPLTDLRKSLTVVTEHQCNRCGLQLLVFWECKRCRVKMCRACSSHVILNPQHFVHPHGAPREKRHTPVFVKDYSSVVRSTPDNRHRSSNQPLASSTPKSLAPTSIRAFASMAVGNVKSKHSTCKCKKGNCSSCACVIRGALCSTNCMCKENCSNRKTLDVSVIEQNEDECLVTSLVHILQYVKPLMEFINKDMHDDEDSALVGLSSCVGLLTIYLQKICTSKDEHQKNTLLEKYKRLQEKFQHHVNHSERNVVSFYKALVQALLSNTKTYSATDYLTLRSTFKVKCFTSAKANPKYKELDSIKIELSDLQQPNVAECISTALPTGDEEGVESVAYSVDSDVTVWLPIEFMDRQSQVRTECPDILTRNHVAGNLSDQKYRDYVLFAAVLMEGGQTRSIVKRINGTWIEQNGDEITNQTAHDNIAASAYLIFYVRDNKIEEFSVSPLNTLVRQLAEYEDKDDFKAPDKNKTKTVKKRKASLQTSSKADNNTKTVKKRRTSFEASSKADYPADPSNDQQVIVVDEPDPLLPTLPLKEVQPNESHIKSNDSTFFDFNDGQLVVGREVANSLLETLPFGDVNDDLSWLRTEPTKSLIGFPSPYHNCYSNAPLSILKYITPVRDAMELISPITTPLMELCVAAAHVAYCKGQAYERAENYNLALSKLCTSLSCDSKGMSFGHFNDASEFLMLLLQQLIRSVKEVDFNSGEQLENTFKSKRVQVTTEDGEQVYEEAVYMNVVYIRECKPKCLLKLIQESKSCSEQDTEKYGQETYFNIVGADIVMFIISDRALRKVAVKIPTLIPSEALHETDGEGDGDFQLFAGILAPPGHFTSIILMDKEKKIWVRHNDAKDVATLQESQALQELSMEGYVLFYVKESLYDKYVNVTNLQFQADEAESSDDDENLQQLDFIDQPSNPKETMDIYTLDKMLALKVKKEEQEDSLKRKHAQATKKRQQQTLDAILSSIPYKNLTKRSDCDSLMRQLERHRETAKPIYDLCRRHIDKCKRSTKYHRSEMLFQYGGKYQRSLLPVAIRGKSTPLSVPNTNKYWHALGTLCGVSPEVVKLASVSGGIINQMAITDQVMKAYSRETIDQIVTNQCTELEDVVSKEVESTISSGKDLGIAHLYLCASALEGCIHVFRGDSINMIEPVKRTLNEPLRIILIGEASNDICCPLVNVDDIIQPVCGAEIFKICLGPTTPMDMAMCKDCGMSYHQDCLRVSAGTISCGCVMDIPPTFQWFLKSPEAQPMNIFQSTDVLQLWKAMADGSHRSARYNNYKFPGLLSTADHKQLKMVGMSYLPEDILFQEVLGQLRRIPGCTDFNGLHLLELIFPEVLAIALQRHEGLNAMQVEAVFRQHDKR